MNTGSGLNDGQWHSVELNSREDHLSITVDKDEGATVHVSIPLPLTADSQLFFGGKKTRQSACIMCMVPVSFLCVSACVFDEKPSLVKYVKLQLEVFCCES